MKKTIISFCCALGLMLLCLGNVCAQSSSGVVIGANYSFYNNSKLNYSHAIENIDYDNGAGLQMGYQWSFPLSKHFEIDLGAMYNFIKGNNTVTNSIPGIKSEENKEPAMFLSAPVSVNYHICKFYIGAGCEGAFSIAKKNDNLPHKYFGLIAKMGYNLGRVDIELKYLLGMPRRFNEDNVDYNSSGEISGTTGYNSSNISTAQLSVIIPFFER